MRKSWCKVSPATDSITNIRMSCAFKFFQEVQGREKNNPARERGQSDGGRRGRERRLGGGQGRERDGVERREGQGRGRGNLGVRYFKWKFFKLTVFG